MAKTPKNQMGLAGQILWLADQDYSGTPAGTPPGWLALNQTATTTITSASTNYPTLYGRYTSTDTKSPIYRSGNNLVIQPMFFEKRTKWFDITSTCVSGNTIWVKVQFCKDQTYWNMKINAYISASSVVVTGVTFPTTFGGGVMQTASGHDMSGGYAVRCYANGSTISFSGATPGSFNGSSAFTGEFILASEPTWTSFPVGSQSYAAVAEQPNQTAFLRLYD